MAHSTVSTDAPRMDYAEHAKSYDLFLGLFKWGAIFCALLLIFMAIFLV
jgi:hypothetical protein